MMMTSKNNERKQELMKYIHMLEGLAKSGYKCHTEITKAMDELKMLMFEEERENRLTVFVFEERGTDLMNSVDLYKKIMGKNTSHRRESKANVLINQDKVIYIIELDSIQEIRNRYRGYNANYIVNNVNMETSHLTDILGIKMV